MKQLILLTTFLLSVTASAFAEDVLIDGLWYGLSSETSEAQVIQYKNNVDYSGDIVIPSTVEYNDKVYSVTSIQSNAFGYCWDLVSVVIPNSVTSIGSSAFSGCRNMLSVSIPNSLTRIEEGTFSGCSSLPSVTIPNSVEYIGSGAFDACSGLNYINITDLTAWCNITFEYNAANPLYYVHHLFLNGEEIKDLVIPDGVTRIKECAFAGCTGLTSVTIPNSVTDIEGWAFYGCASLTSITIGNGLTYSGNNPFWECDAITSVHITDLEAWCGIDFMSVASNPLFYAHHLFLNGEEVTDLVIPSTLTAIRNNVFYSCKGLTSVVIPNEVKTIGKSAFAECSNITTITLGSGLTRLGELAFYNSGGLQLKDVYCYAVDIPEGYTNTWRKKEAQEATLHVPQASVENYMYEFPWNFFKEIVPLEDDDPNPSLIAEIDGAESKAEVYNLIGNRVSQPTKNGLYIIKGKKVIIKNK